MIWKRSAHDAALKQDSKQDLAAKPDFDPTDPKNAALNQKPAGARSETNGTVKPAASFALPPLGASSGLSSGSNGEPPKTPGRPSNEPQKTAANPFATPPDGGSPFRNPVPQNTSKTTAGVLGELVWLMSQSALHKSFFISDLEWFIMTPVYLQQFRLYYDPQKPIGAVLWGSLSDEVEARLVAGESKMRPQDWKSGDKLWVVEVIAPFGGAEAMVADLKEKVFPGRAIKMLALTTDGKREVSRSGGNADYL